MDLDVYKRQVLICALGKVIFIHKVISCVIRSINVDHLDFAEIGFLQQLQHFEIVALNIEAVSYTHLFALLGKPGYEELKEQLSKRL